MDVVLFEFLSGMALKKAAAFDQDVSALSVVPHKKAKPLT